MNYFIQSSETDISPNDFVVMRIQIDIFRNTIKVLLIVLLTSSFVYCKESTIPYDPGLVVILKADDLGEMTPNWERFMHIIFKDSICGSIGIIADRMKSDSTVDEIRKISGYKRDNKFPVIEFWNHGYNHIKNKNGTEFDGSTIEYQANHLQMTQEFMNDKLRIQCHTFGAPYNRTDINTLKALYFSPEICVWFCLKNLEKEEKKGWKNPDDHPALDNNKILLDVDYYFYKIFPVDKMMNNYSKDRLKPYIVIQVHPLMWKDKNFDDFETLIKFYKSRKTTFMTPFQYYQYLNDIFEGDTRI